MTGEAVLKRLQLQDASRHRAVQVGGAGRRRAASIRIRRRNDYWAANHRRNIGTANFDEIQQEVVRDRSFEFEMFKRGDVDYYFVQRAQEWVQELNYPNIKRGLNQKRKIFNHNPVGIAGIAMNTRREPYNDIRVRLRAATPVQPRVDGREADVQRVHPDRLVLPGQRYENPSNEKVRYDPQRAIQLLAEAGWKDRDTNGRLTQERPSADH